MVKQSSVKMVSAFFLLAFSYISIAFSEPNKGVLVIDLNEGTLTKENGKKEKFTDSKTQSSKKMESYENLSELEKFATAGYYHGISSEDAAAFIGQDCSSLFQLLRDQRYEDNWPNIVHVLGLIGDEKAVNELIAYAEDDSNNTLSAVKAKAFAQYSLGILAGRLNSEKAEQYVISGLELDKWKSRRDFDAVDPEFYQGSAVTYAVWGLSAAGTPKAIKTLEDYSKRLNSNSTLKAKMNRFDINPNNIKERIKQAKKVQSLGFFKAQLEFEKQYQNAQ